MENSLRYLDLDRLLDISTAYMISGISAVTVFSDIAVQQKVKLLAYLLHGVYLMSIAIVALVLIYHVVFLKKKTLMIVFSGILAVALFTIFNMIHPNYNEIFSHFIISKFLKHGYVLFILVLLEPNYEKVVKYCCSISRITIIIFSSILFLTEWFANDYLTVSDNLGLGVVIVLGWAIYKGSIVDYAIGVFGLLAMILFGDRAHIVCILGAFLLWGMKKIPSNPYAKRFRVIFCIVIIGIAVAFFFYADKIIIGLTVFLSNIGVDSRNISYILDARLSDSSGRDIFYANIWNAIKKNPFGYGILGDVILNYENGITSIITGAYTHNGYLQALCEFGVFIGNAIWIWIIVNAIRIYKTITESETYILYVALCCLGVFILMFSYSYWICVPFWGFLALLINENKKET